MISVHHTSTTDASGELSRFRHEFYHCLTTRADALFELADAALCTDGPVTSLVELSLTTEHRRGHGSLYDSLNSGRIDTDRFRDVITSQAIPRRDGRIVLAIDVSHWLRPDAGTSPQRMFCHTYGRGKGQAQMIPGWPYSFIAALEPGRSSWTALLDAVRVGPGDDRTDLAANQLRDVVQRLIDTGHWHSGDPEIWIVGDSGYDGVRLAFLLADLPIAILVRLRSDRVLRFPAPARAPGTRGRPVRHGARFEFTSPAGWPAPAQSTTTGTTRYGTAHAQSWDRLHTKLTRTGAWAGHEEPLPIVEGTLIRLEVQRLPGTATPKPLWLWHSSTTRDIVTASRVDQLWQMFLRRFDLEHTFRFLKQTLGWTRPRIRDPHAADRWTWLMIAACTQLRLGRVLVEDQPRPWERAPSTPARLSPVRVRRGFRALRPLIASHTNPPKSSREVPPVARRLSRHGPIGPEGSRPWQHRRSTPTS
ncbi:hypothetical protein JOF53_006437 [Crossiella equi]|uniref:Transposase IS701-like DDE domain-containing protein n=2 Tax=Crossiella equi TaxID=130796 RepID=A0ABS5APG1_9PSEU|nr:NF041680 family putative transposase [Crossiella equi]MBP2477565.1 hypothetical protein [Crossiella equi]